MDESTAVGVNWWVAQHCPPTLKRKSVELWVEIRLEFDRQEPPMTVRQMYYRMSSRGVVPKTENGYRQVQYALAAMRRAGAIPYGWIADNTRWRRKPHTHSDMRSALAEMHHYYRRELWANQPVYVEIWLEKDALAGVVSAVTNRYDVPLYVARGYSSLSYLYEAAEELRSIDKPAIIYHFGDYDASGQDAARALQEGLREFGAEFEFVQAAVTEEQIERYQLQTRAAKKHDPRAKNHGDYAVELDAIEPSVLRSLVEGCITQHIDTDALSFTLELERREKEVIGDWLRGLE